MGLITAEQYKASLNDGRQVYYKGEKVKNVATHPDLSVCVNVMAIDYEMAENPETRDLAVMKDPNTGEEISRYYYKPQNADDLIKAHELIVKATELGDGYIPLAHDIGADALNAINITANMMGNKDYIERIENYRKELQQKDLATCAGVTCVKGDRMLRPSDPGQANPDFYVRVVDRNAKGIVVRGAKIHITGAAYSNDIFAIPCRAMTDADKDYAVAFAIPANTKGIKQVCRPFTSHISPLEFPITNTCQGPHGLLDRFRRCAGAMGKSLSLRRMEVCRDHGLQLRPDAQADRLCLPHPALRAAPRSRSRHCGVQRHLRGSTCKGENHRPGYLFRDSQIIVQDRLL